MFLGNSGFLFWGFLEIDKNEIVVGCLTFGMMIFGYFDVLEMICRNFEFSDFSKFPFLFFLFHRK